MKKQKIQKKLDLNKQTIANLGKEEMAGVQGGFFITELISWLLGCNTELIKRPSIVCNR